MAFENTTLVKGGNSYTYDVFRQHNINNCGPSSIVMTIKQATTRTIAIGFAQMMVGKMELFSGKRSASAADARWHSWDNSATGGYSYMGDLLNTIKKKWPELRATDTDNGLCHPEKLAACTPNKPALTHVAWSNGGGHFVVCLGKKIGSNDLVFLDPYYGVVVCDYYNHGDYALRYSTHSNSFGKRGSWAVSKLAIYTNPV
jgi:hypothetical protein